MWSWTYFDDFWENEKQLKPNSFNGFRGRSEETRTPDILTSCHLRCPKLFARCSRRTILTATPISTPFIRHRRRSCS